MDDHEMTASIAILREEYEAQVLAGIQMLCCLLWQYASRRCREKYPRFAMRQSEFLVRVQQYEDAPENERISIDGIIDILDSFINIRAAFDGDIRDPATAGTVLARASLGGCFLGAPASRGDVEEYVRLLHAEGERNPKGLTPRTLWRMRARGNQVPLLLFLNAKLADSAAQLQALTLKRGSGAHLGPIVYDEEEEAMRLDAAVLMSRFALHQALVAELEPVPGHA